MQGQLVCAWCNKKKKDVELVTQGQSHGICPACLLTVFGFTPEQLAQHVIDQTEVERIRKAKRRLERRQAKKRRATHVS